MGRHRLHLSDDAAPPVRERGHRGRAGRPADAAGRSPAAGTATGCDPDWRPRTLARVPGDPRRGRPDRRLLAPALVPSRSRARRRRSSTLPLSIRKSVIRLPGTELARVAGARRAEVLALDALDRGLHLRLARADADPARRSGRRARRVDRVTLVLPWNITRMPPANGTRPTARSRSSRAGLRSACRAPRAPPRGCCRAARRRSRDRPGSWPRAAARRSSTAAVIQTVARRA